MQDILIKVLMWLITTLSNIFVTPVVTLLTNLMPDLGLAITNVLNFISTYVVTYLQFAIRVFVNCTGVSQALISLVVSYISFKILLHSVMKIYKLIVKIWMLVKP